MLIEIYKGVEISHDAVKDEFYTTIVINKRQGKKDEVIKSGRLGAVRDDINKFLNTAAKKPVTKQAWYKGRNEYDPYEKVEVIIYNAITGGVMVQKKDGTSKTISAFGGQYREDKLYLACKENDAIVAKLNKNREEVDRIRKEVSCSSGKLIPIKPEHFV